MCIYGFVSKEFNKIYFAKQVVRRPEQEGFRDHQGPERHPRDGQEGGLQDPQEGIGEEEDGRNENERSLVKVTNSNTI